MKPDPVDVSIDDIIEHDPCWVDARIKIEKLFGDRERITLKEYSELPVSSRDRLWGMLLLWPNRSVTVANKAVDRQVKAQCLDCGLPEVQEWAKRWLSGEDRTYAAAYVVADVADCDAAAAAAYAAAAAAAYAAADVADCDAADAAYAATDGAACAAADGADAREQENKAQIADFLEGDKT